MARRDPSGDPEGRLPAAVRRRLAAARWALAWEAFWPALQPALGVAALVVSAAWLGVLQALPDWLHWSVLAGAAAALLACLGRAAARLRPGNPATARRRLEAANALAHRPIDVLLDRRAGPADAVGKALWRRHRARARAQLDGLAPVRPRPQLAARDPWGLRFAGALVVVVAATLSWGQWPARLATGLNPAAGPAASAPASVTAWLTPPDYTGQPPVYLTDRSRSAQDAAPQVPAGSQLTVTVQGVAGPPVLVVGGARLPLSRAGSATYRLQRELGRNGPLVLRHDGSVLRRWPLTVTADQIPTVELTKPPQASAQGALTLRYRAVDDHGLTGLKAKIDLAVAGPQAPGLSFPAPQLDLPRPGKATNTASSTHHVAGHPWAGLPVELTLAATDGAGQTGRSATVELTLPARSFDHPVAAEIAALRRKLVQQPAQAGPIAGELDALAARPAAFKGDGLTFLGLRSAAERLRLQQSPEARRSVVDLLWAVATHLEDGGLARARAELRELERQLREALQSGASGERVDKLLKQFQKALAAYRQALAEKLSQQQTGAPPPPGAQQSRNVGDMLGRQLDKLRQNLETGNRQAAQKLLERLSRTLDSLQRAQPRRAQQQGQGRALSRELAKLMDRQRRLMDATHARRGASGTPDRQPKAVFTPGIVPPPPLRGRDKHLDGLAQRQGELEERLGALNQALKELGGVPPAMKGAERAMQRARKALEQGKAGRATQRQAAALNRLQQGGKQARQQLRRAGRGAGALLPGSGRRGPLGRPLGTQDGAGGDVEIPGEGEQKRAREILEELRRKRDAAPPGSPLSDYLDRLLERF